MRQSLGKLIDIQGIKMITAFIVKNPLSSFVVINYLISWIFLYPCYQLILNAENGNFPILALIGLVGAYGPTISAIIVEKFTAGNIGVKNLLKKLLIWRVNFGWYFFIFTIPLILYGLSVWSSELFGFQLGESNSKVGISSAFIFILLALPFGPMGEELGWRGFMLPRLLKRYNAWTSSLILGFIWTFWHTASFTFPGAAIPSAFELSIWTLFLYLLNICASTLLMTVVFLKTKGSVLIAILFHATFNACANIVLTIFPEVEKNVAQREVIYITNIILTALLAVIMLLINHSTKGVKFD
jgi:membrane protease YdiL (CAAX protease family)